MISVIINTCALERNTHSKTPQGVPYNSRAYALRNFILPRYIADPYISEIIVVGSWEEGEGYRYIHSPSKYFSAVDALEQRQIGFEVSRNNILVFQHDDHFIELDWNVYRDLDLGFSLSSGYDVVSPARYTRLRNVSGERLNGGEPGYNQWSTSEGHINGHCAIFSREVIEKCPWTSANKIFTWDISMTQNIKAAGFKIIWHESIKCWDVEMGSEPWL